jgi:ethanolamine utilization protein EutQ (cupin superfamily)
VETGKGVNLFLVYYSTEMLMQTYQYDEIRILIAGSLEILQYLNV